MKGNWEEKTLGTVYGIELLNANAQLSRETPASWCCRMKPPANGLP